ILLTMSAPGLVEKKSSVDYRLILRGRSAAMVSFPDNDRRLNALYRVYTSESPHCTKVRGKRYQLSPISSIKLRPYVGPIYQFDVKPSYPSLVTAGAAVGSTSWHDIKGAGAFATELCRNFMGRLNNPYTWRSESGQGQVHVT